MYYKIMILCKYEHMPINNSDVIMVNGIEY